MVEFVPNVPEQMGRAVHAGRELAGMALTHVREQLGSVRAMRNAEDALLDNLTQRVEGTIMACDYDWHPAALGNALSRLPTAEKRQALNQLIAEQEVLPKLEAVHKRLDSIRQSQYRPAILPIVQYGNELVSRATGGIVPGPRQPSD